MGGQRPERPARVCDSVSDGVQSPARTKGEINVKAMLAACLMAAAKFVMPAMTSAVLPHDLCEGTLHPAYDVTVATGLCEGHE